MCHSALFVMSHYSHIVSPLIHILWARFFLEASLLFMPFADKLLAFHLLDEYDVHLLSPKLLALFMEKNDVC